MEAILNKLQSIAGGDITEKRRIAESEVGGSWIIELAKNGRKSTVFLKCCDADESDDFGVYFRNEHTFYDKILREFSALSAVCFSAGCIHAGVNYFALEDITTQGFKTLDFKRGVCAKDAKAIVGCLGKFHAFSFALKERRFEEFRECCTRLKETVFTLDKRKLFTFAMHDALKLVKQSLPSDSVYVEKLSVFTLNVFERMSTLAKGDCDEDHVFTHGDLWPNNILINETGEVKLIDFNSCRLASPVHDLALLLLVALDAKTRADSRDDLIKTYHNSLCEKLRQLHCDPHIVFPFSSLEKQLREHTRFALAAALAGLPLLMDDGGPVQMEQDADPLLAFVQKIHARKSMKCKNKVIEIVMDVVNQGYLD